MKVKKRVETFRAVPVCALIEYKHGSAVVLPDWVTEVLTKGLVKLYWGEILLEIMGHPVIGRMSDWLMIDGDSNLFICDERTFHKVYEPIDA